MSLLSNLNSANMDVEATDNLGGFTLFDSDIYLATIKTAYAKPANSGALGIGLVLDINGKEYRETMYVTNKSGENFYKTKDGKKAGLPGFNLIDALCVVATDKPLCQQSEGTKKIALYNAELKKEVPTDVTELSDLAGKQVYVAILKKTENKRVFNTNTNSYDLSEETRDVNAIDGFMHNPTKLTKFEAEHGKTEPEFFNKWLERNKGKVKDQTKKVVGSPNSVTKPVSSLFGNK